MRGGRVYVRDNIGYRGGIHMKQYMEKRPIVVIGGAARAFLGEYMRFENLMSRHEEFVDAEMEKV